MQRIDMLRKEIEERRIKDQEWREIQDKKAREHEKNVKCTDRKYQIGTAVLSAILWFGFAVAGYYLGTNQPRTTNTNPQPTTIQLVIDGSQFPKQLHRTEN